MFLYDIFLELDSFFNSDIDNTLPYVLTDCLLTRVNVDMALEQKAFVRHSRLIGLQYDASKVAAYKAFLQSCDRGLGRLDETPLLNAIMNGLADEVFPNHHETCDKLTRLFFELIRYQHDLLSIIPLGRTLISSPSAFAAFLRSLVWRGVSNSQILSSHLLQDFFLYYMSSLGRADNAIVELYQILETFSDMSTLCELAQQVCCNEPGFSSYSLDGQSHEAGSLTTYVHDAKAICFTPDKTNLGNLHVLFGVDFLERALYQRDIYVDNLVWHDTLTNLFNQKNTVNLQLPELLNRIYENTLVKQYLANLLSHQTVNQLHQRHVVGILSLISYRPGLIDDIKSEEMQNYLSCLREKSSSDLTLISNLCALLNAVSHRQDMSEQLVFDALLESVLSVPSVFDDPLMMGRLRKFSSVKDSLTRKARLLETRLEATINLQTEARIDDLDFISIDDVWREVSSQIQHLQKISYFKTSCPSDKYKLYTRIALSFFNKKDNEFNLNSFSAALGIKPVFDEHDISLYERLILELLACIDDEQLRRTCIEILDRHVVRPWRTYTYNNTCLFEQAVLAGHTDLIKWLETENIKPRSYSYLMITAAQMGQWTSVVYLYTFNSVHKSTRNILLHLAVMQGALCHVPVLWSGEFYLPTLKAIEQAYKYAVQHNDIESIRCLNACPRLPSRVFMTALLEQATRFEYFEIANLIQQQTLSNNVRPILSCLEPKKIMGSVGFFSTSPRFTAPISQLEKKDTNYISTSSAVPR